MNNVLLFIHLSRAIKSNEFTERESHRIQDGKQIKKKKR